MDGGMHVGQGANVEYFGFQGLKNQAHGGPQRAPSVKVMNKKYFTSIGFSGVHSISENENISSNHIQAKLKKPPARPLPNPPTLKPLGPRPSVAILKTKNENHEVPTNKDNLSTVSNGAIIHAEFNENAESVKKASSEIAVSKGDSVGGVIEILEHYSINSGENSKSKEISIDIQESQILEANAFKPKAPDKSNNVSESIQFIWTTITELIKCCCWPCATGKKETKILEEIKVVSVNPSEETHHSIEMQKI